MYALAMSTSYHRSRRAVEQTFSKVSVSKACLNHVIPSLVHTSLPITPGQGLQVPPLAIGTSFSQPVSSGSLASRLAHLAPFNVTRDHLLYFGSFTRDLNNHSSPGPSLWSLLLGCSSSVPSFDHVEKVRVLQSSERPRALPALGIDPGSQPLPHTDQCLFPQLTCSHDRV